MIKDLTKSLISYKTVYPNKEEFNKCFAFIKNYLQESNLYIKEYKYNDDKALIISNCKTKDYDLIMCGHIDVVSAIETLFNATEEKGRLYGRGSFDMKGHVAVMLEIMKNIKTTRKICLLLTSDEERGGFNGTNRLINNLGYKAKIAIVPDAGKDFDLITEEKGVLQLNVKRKGIEAHSSQPYNGENSILKLIDVYNYLLSLINNNITNEFYTTINLSSLIGAGAINKVPDKAIMTLDIRYTFNDCKTDFIKLIKEYDNKVEIEVIAQADPFLLDVTNFLVLKYLKISEEILQRPINLNKCASSSDGRYFSNNNIPCIMMNANGDNLHANNEYVEVESLEKLYEIYKRFIENI